MKLIAFILTTIVLVSSCNNTSNPADENKAGENIAAKPSPSKRYGIPSGIIEYKLTGSTSVTETLFFDSFGQREVKIGQSAAGKGLAESKTSKYIIDDFGYHLNDLDKNGIKVKMPFYSNKDIRENIGLLNPALLSINGAIKVGTEKFLDRECEKWVNSKDSSELLFWQGIRLRFKKTTMGKESLTEAISVQENATIPEGKFSLPQGYELNDLTAGANTGPQPDAEKEMEMKIISTIKRLKYEGDR